MFYLAMIGYLVNLVSNKNLNFLAKQSFLTGTTYTMSVAYLGGGPLRLCPLGMRKTF